MDAAAAAQAAGAGGNQQQHPAAPAAAPRAERLNSEVQNQLNLEGMRARAVGLYKAISRILEDFDAIARTNPNASPKWYGPPPSLPSHPLHCRRRRLLERSARVSVDLPSGSSMIVMLLSHD